MNGLDVYSTSDICVGCVGVLLLGMVWMTYGVCWLGRDSVCWRVYVPVREMLPMSAVLPVCMYMCVCVCLSVCGGGGPLDAVWCSWVFTV